MDKMKAWVLTKQGKTPDGFQLQDVDKPAPGNTEVLLRVQQFGLNFADVMAMYGLYRDCPPLPAILGYDIAGEIEAVGPEVNGLKPGDRVAGMTRFGGNAEYAVTDQQGVLKLPDQLPLETGVALATQGITAQYMAAYIQPIRSGERVLIHAAAGGVGTILVQMALHSGCDIFATAGSPEKLEKLRQMGVQHPINYREDDFAEVIRNHFHGRGLDVVFDPVGGESVKKGIKLLRPGGRMIAFGGSSFIGKGGILGKLLTFWRYGFYHPLLLVGGSRTIAGVNMLRLADHRPEIITQCLEEMAQLTVQGIVQPEIFRVFPAGEFPQALSMLQNRQTIGKVVVSWET